MGTWPSSDRFSIDPVPQHADPFSLPVLLKGSLAQLSEEGLAKVDQEHDEYCSKREGRLSDEAMAFMWARDFRGAWEIIHDPCVSAPAFTHWITRVGCNFRCANMKNIAQKLSAQFSEPGFMNVTEAQCEEVQKECLNWDGTGRGQKAKDALAKLEKQNALDLERQQQQEQARTQREEAQKARQAALKKQQEDRARQVETRKQARKQAQEDNLWEAEQAKQKAIEADKERRAEFINCLTWSTPDFVKAERIRSQSKWSAKDLRDLVNTALRKITSGVFSDNCDKAGVVHKHFSGVSGLCTPKRTTWEEKLFDGSCKLDCGASNGGGSWFNNLFGD